MQDKTEQVCKKVLERITPRNRERIDIKELTAKLEKRVRAAAEELKVEAIVRVEGSVAKDTWLSKEPDVDIFMRVSKTIPRKSLGDVCLKIARKATEGSRQVERFAEHPYLEAVVGETRVNIVPCYNTKLGEWFSATDRTPFHTDYINKHIDEQLRNEVRLLKKFMKGIGVYGAEIKVGGFSGYLCELMILQYGGFVNTLKTLAQHRQRVIFDTESYYRDRKSEIDLLFNEPLVAIDPVDKGRNVASAVQPQKLHLFAAASQCFLKNPDEQFFYPEETVALTVKELKLKLAKHGSALAFITFGKVDAVPDVLWGQLYRSQRSLSKLVETSGYLLLRNTPWSDEKSANMFILELEQRILPPVRIHLGPPLEREQECGRFLAKYLNNSTVVSGPFVDNGRWIVEIKRKYTDVVALLEERLKDGGKKAGVAEQIAQVLSKGFRIFVNDEIAQIYEKNGEFAKFLTDFLSGKPKWLKKFA